MPKKDYLVIDIETMPDLSKVDMLPEPSISKVLKDPIKIKEAQENAILEQISKMALKPETGIIACIGYGNITNGDIHIENEKEMLESFFKRISGKTIVTFNGINFDLPFIYKRAMLLNVDVPYSLESFIKHYSTTFHVDLMQIWSGWSSQGFVSLDYLSSLILGKKKVDFDFKEIPELLKTSNGIKRLSDYCLKDIELTTELFNKMKGYLFND